MRIYTKEVATCEDCPEYIEGIRDEPYCMRSKRRIDDIIPDWCELDSRGYSPMEMEE